MLCYHNSVEEEDLFTYLTEQTNSIIDYYGSSQIIDFLWLPFINLTDKHTGRRRDSNEIFATVNNKEIVSVS